MIVVRSIIDAFLKQHGITTRPVILGGCALFMYGLRECFNDIDLLVPELKNPVEFTGYSLKLDAAPRFMIGHVDRTQEVIDTAVQRDSGLLLMSPVLILEHKRFMNREKDLPDIEKLEALLR